MGNPPASLLATMVRRGCLAGLAIGAFLGACANTDQNLERQRLLEELNTAGGKKAQCKPGIVEACYEGPEGTVGRGICKDGTRKCSDDALWGACTGQVLPVAPELCNKKDDDCDGIVDNDFERDGATCTIGKGECKTSGVWRCNPDGKGTTCDAPPPTIKAEVCDGEDNDCDGQIDEDIQGTGGACQTGKPGVCAPGLMKCLGGKVQCVQNIQPSVEICNNQDDDCNNQVDDRCLTAEEAAKLGRK